MPLQEEKPGHAALTSGAETALHTHPPKANFAATAPPTANNDSSQGYGVGSHWVDVVADISYICVDASVGAAVWKTDIGGGGGTSLAEVWANTGGG